MSQHPFDVEHEGMIIRGTAYKPDRGGRYPTVLLLHGFTGQRIESGFIFVALGRELARRGVAAVTFDFRHSGESDGSFERMLVTGELSDALRMTQWLQGQPFVDRSHMGLLGFSLGGLVAACTVARTDAYNALALMAPTTVENLCRHAVGPDGNEKAKPLVMGPHTLHDDFFDDVRTLDPVADVVQHPRPTLLVQGTADVAVTPQVSQHFVDALKREAVPLAVESIPGADHGFNRPDWRRALIAAVAGFFAEHLSTRP